MDIVELGVSVSTTPQLSLYWNSLDLAVFGYSNFDGYLIGWGGRHPLFTRLHNKCYGLIVSYEEVAWGDYEDDPGALHKRIGGLAGLPGLVFGTEPLDSPSCVHFFPHLGFVGLVWNLRWGQIVDFAVGWTTIDLGHDDGPQDVETGQENMAVLPVSYSSHAEPVARPVPAAGPPAPPSGLADAGRSAAAEQAPAQSPPPEAQRTHLVLKGETLSAISREYYGTSAKWRDILDANQSVVSDERKLQPGMELVIPGK